MQLLQKTPLIRGDHDGSAVEGQGSGIQFMINRMKELSLAQPDFHPTFDRFRVILYRGGAEIAANQQWVRSHVGHDLPGRESSVLYTVRALGRASVYDIRDRLDMIQTTSVRYWPRWWNPGSSDRWLPTYMNLRRHRPSPMPAMPQRLQQQRHRADKPSSTRSPRSAQSAHATSRRRQAKACRQCTAFCASSWMKVSSPQSAKAEPSAHLHTQTDHRLTASRARG